LKKKKKKIMEGCLDTNWNRESWKHRHITLMTSSNKHGWQPKKISGEKIKLKEKGGWWKALRVAF